MMNEDQQEKQRRDLYGLLGRLPPRAGKISAATVTTEERESYLLERLVLDINGTEPVPALFIKPKKSAGPAPAVLYNHAHGGNYQLGKEELISGRDALQNPPYAENLARMGFCSLCIDTWAFGERRGRSESELFKQMLWSGQVMWGMMVYDNLRALDYLLSRPEVNTRRIATMGISMGSTMAWWTAALDTRIKVCVDICCLTDFHALIEARGLDGHGIYYYVPRLLEHWTTAKINALIAPRPHLAIAGEYDRLTPPDGLDRIDDELRKVYKRCHAAAAWKLIRHQTGHYETPSMRKQVLDFLQEWL